MDKFDIARRVRLLNEASDAYYNTGNPIMSDSQFDQLLDELKEWEDETGIVLSNSPTQNVGAAILDSINEVTHTVPMLSLDKVHSVEEIEKFSGGNQHELIASVKLDGISCRLTYQDGELIRAESRGNGIVGSDITEHIKQFKNIPLHINKKGTYVIDGEALIKLDDFAEINKNGEFKNSRNLTAGTLSSLDISVVKDRRLSWYAWKVIEGAEPDVDDNSFYDTLKEATLLGFDVVPHSGIFICIGDMCQKMINTMLKYAHDLYLPQDGVVFRFDDLKYGESLGRTSHHFRGATAWKAPNNSVETTLKRIDFTMGKTGILTPVAIFEPVEIEDTIVEKASLHNLSVMKEIMGTPWVGQRMGVCKANLIIPQVKWAEVGVKSVNKRYIKIPDKCPICGQPTEIRKDNDSQVLMCTNDNCKGKLLGKLTHTVSRDALNIDGFSEASINKFIDLGLLNSIQDIYHLSDHKKELESLDGFGKKSIEKLLNSIEKSRITNLQRFLYALSIPLLGKSASKDIAEFCDYKFDVFVDNIQVDGKSSFTAINGIGEALGQSIIDYWNKNDSKIIDLSKEFIFEFEEPICHTSNNKLLDGLIFVITGSLEHYSNRDALKSEIESYGGKVFGSISSKTSYLINNDVNSTSSKNKKAQSLNIPIISEDQFISMIS